MAIDISRLFTDPDAAVAQSLGKTNYSAPLRQTLRPMGKGSIVMFRYGLAKPGHDQTPLVLLTDVMPQYLRGINLHYLTFPTIKNMLQTKGMNACNNRFFSYSNIKSNKYITSAFRMYKRTGIQRLRTLDCEYILNAMGSVRALDPQELETIRSDIKSQLDRIVNQPIA
jgi:hypothetical protein